MRIFLSHASEQADVAKAIEVALRAEGHSVFLDRSSLPAGETYHDQIRAAIAESDLLVFLVSPEAVAAGRYTITEVELAEERWPSPAGGILPVLVRPTPVASIPPYVRGVTMLEPRGNLPAAVVAAVDRLAIRGWRRFARPSRIAALAVVVAIAAAGAGWWGYRHATTRAELTRLAAEGDRDREAGSYATAWDTYARAAALAPDPDVLARQERLAMDWLENIRVTAGKDTFASIVEKVRPVLSRCAASPERVRAADCLAHLGWGDYLRSRDGEGGLDPVQHYRRAVASDADNPYANAMWGHHLLHSGGSLESAQAHFARAVASGRERPYVRTLQIAGLLYRREPAREEQLVRVLNEMRAGGEDPPRRQPGRIEPARLWSVYYDRLVNGYARSSFLAALPGADHLATFRWLFPEDSVPADRRNLHRFMLATFQEQAGERADALASYRALASALAGEGGGTVSRLVAQALDRLSKAH
ncbi:MAG: toll/interleukin-1 receptor domain-containing protein [Candidatus Rokubacteria bacterium]|nr:toll/interleukin-1 receptor domain-containing protein [Candidatus Rokubacteria bacterium]